MVMKVMNRDIFSPCEDLQIHGPWAEPHPNCPVSPSYGLSALQAEMCCRLRRPQPQLASRSRGSRAGSFCHSPRNLRTSATQHHAMGWRLITDLFLEFHHYAIVYSCR